MKPRLAHYLARLYPAAWRERYGEEFDALVEDSRPGWRGLADIARGAVAMRLQTPPSLARAAFWFGLAGLAVAAPLALLWRDTFLSVGVIETPFTEGSRETVARAVQGVMRRDALADLIDRHKLYPDKRDRMPKEDLIELLRRNISISRVTPLRSAPGKAAFRVAFEDEDRAMTSAVTRDVMTLVIDEYARQNRSAPSLEVLDGASMPQQPVKPNRPVLVFIFIAGGAMLGAMVALIRRDGPLRILRFAAIGAIAGAAIVMSGVAYRRQVSPPMVEAIVEMESDPPSTPSYEALTSLAKRHGFASVADLRPNLTIETMAAPKGWSRVRIAFTHPDGRVADAVVRDVLATMHIPGIPAIFPSPSYSARLPDITGGALLGVGLALVTAGIRRRRVPQPA